MWFLFDSKAKLNCDTACAAIDKFPFDQLVKIPWSHNLIIISKCKDTTEAFYYISKTIEHHWSRNVLTHQIESELYEREGKAVSIRLKSTKRADFVTCYVADSLHTKRNLQRATKRQNPFE